VSVSTIIDAHHKRDGIVGSAEFDNDDGTLHEIEVHPDHRRKGIATGMWNHAKTVGLNPQHSNVRSRQGDAWANSMATPVPDNVWPNQDAKPSEDGIENDHFSTAFTAPGYHHPYTNEDFPEALGYAPKRRTAALHDIALPKPGDNYYKSDEEKAANKAKYDGEIKEFHSKVKQEAGLPEDAALLEAKRHWDRGIKHALTTGDMTIDEAEAKNYHGDHREHGDSGWEHDYKRHGGWQNLASNSNHYAHVSTDADAAAKDGLKTRHELNQLKGGSGLGGGSDDTVSVTDDKDLPNDIYHALHEHHAVVSGKITPEQLHNYAKNPPHGMTPFHESIVKPGSPEEDDFERLKKGVDSKGDPLSEEDKTSQHSQFYKRFSTMREYAGKGHRDPLFMSNDPVAFSKTDPKKFGIMHLKPHPKAQGYPLNPGQSHHGMADSGEWRMGSGSPFDVDHVERPTRTQ
jgi:GNAT superfamily N-acetyltransferase